MRLQRHECTKALVAVAALALLGCGGAEFEVSIFPDAGELAQRDPKPENVSEAGQAPTVADGSGAVEKPEAMAATDAPSTAATDVVVGLPPPPSCSSTCAGCCDRPGDCFSNLDTACGVNGAACVDCTAASAVCKVGVCVVSAAPQDAAAPGLDASATKQFCCFSSTGSATAFCSYQFGNYYDHVDGNTCKTEPWGPGAAWTNPNP